MNRAIDRYDGGLSPGNIYNINILEALRMAHQAWNEVDSTTIRNCWRKADILPNSLDSCPTPLPVISVSSLLNSDPVDDGIAAAEKEVTDTLSNLEERGILHTRNRLTLEELLNPVSERVILSGSEDDIYQAVMERVEGEQNQEINGGDDGDIDIIPKPTRGDALKAASLLQEYVLDMDESFAREMEAILAKFGRQTRLAEVKSLHLSAITDYFTPIDANT
ncbi:hypothetical protein C0991_012351 [Blastosporella zonata]|nr:hypothetical protein C0991_012351 [Blastosporella zonata]